MRKTVLAFLLLNATLFLVAQDTRLISEHVKKSLIKIRDSSKSSDSTAFSDGFNFITSETPKGDSYKLDYNDGEIFKVTWDEYGSDIEVFLFKDRDLTYGFISINGGSVSKGLIVRSPIDELFYLKFSDGFLGWLNKESLSNDEIIDDVESIYFLDQSLKPLNIATFEKGRITQLNLDGEYYSFNDECSESMNLKNIGFDILGLLLTDVECGWVSESGTIEEFEDWLAYYQFDEYKFE